MPLKLHFAIFLIVSLLATACSKKDTTLPEISLKGNALIVISLNSPYTDAGATATDNFDGFLSVETTGTVDTNFAGTYYITYKAMDMAGNEAQAIRTVVVRNEADVYNGSYDAFSVIGTDTTWFNAPLIISNTLNHRIWLVGYSNAANASVYADFRHDTIIVPEQQVNAGVPAIIHGFSGSGFIKTINDHTVFEISFNDSVSGNIYHGTSVYTKN